MPDKAVGDPGTLIIQHQNGVNTLRQVAVFATALIPFNAILGDIIAAYSHFNQVARLNRSGHG